MEKNPHIFISCGERSGDEHAALVATALQEKIPGCTVSAVGGPELRKAGATIIRDITDTAGIMGFTGVLRHLPKLFKQFKATSKYIEREKPDLCIFVDYPDFNLRLAKVAKGFNCQTLYYIPPKVWAWRKGRVELFKRFIDTTAVIFPFEKKFFEGRGYLQSHFVGHPFSVTLQEGGTDIARAAARKKVCDALGANPDTKIIALFPGSRRSEIASHARLTLDLIGTLHKARPDYVIVIAATKALSAETGSAFEAAGALVTRDLDSITVLQAADCAVLKSGTSNLQAAFTNTPCCMFFQTGVINEKIIRTFVALTYYSPLNIVLPGTTKEFIQRDATGKSLGQQTMQLIEDGKIRTAQLEAYAKIRQLLATPESGAVPADSVAQLAFDLLQ